MSPSFGLFFAEFTLASFLVLSSSFGILLFSHLMPVLLINSYGHTSVPLFVQRFSSREKRVPLHPFAAELWTRGKVSSFIINFQYKWLKILIKLISREINYRNESRSFSWVRPNPSPGASWKNHLHLPSCLLLGLALLWFNFLSARFMVFLREEICDFTRYLWTP